MKTVLAWNPMKSCPTCKIDLLNVQLGDSYRNDGHVFNIRQMLCTNCGFETPPIEFRDDYIIVDNGRMDNSAAIIMYPTRMDKLFLKIDNFILRFEKKMNKFADCFDNHEKL